MSIFKKYFQNKKVIITGHTGFKGSWLALWCTLLGAKVYGISKKLIENPSHYKKLGIKRNISDIMIDIRNQKKVKKIFQQIKPDYIFHLAAQSLVKKSFNKPLYTFETNTLGTLNILEAFTSLKNRCHAVIITSDKSYKNLEIKRGYNERDLLGGDDPYSGSKGAAELVINSYFKSFIKLKKNLSINVTRAGNVIGGGDWSRDRVVPDCIKSWSKNKLVKIRNPKSTRPWQHVLEVIRGYLQCAILGKKFKSKLNGEIFNFGPKKNQNKSVMELVKQMQKNLIKVKLKIKKEKGKKESNLLKLNSNKAKKILKWEPILNFQESVKLTALWYKQFYNNKISCYNLSKKQILFYEEKLDKHLIKKKIKLL